MAHDRILHVVVGPSFLEWTSAAFEEAAPGRNVFVGVGVDAERLGSLATNRVESVSTGAGGRSRLRDLVDGSAIAIFHNVVPKTAGALASASASVLTVWSGWGGDYYGTAYNTLAGQLDTETRRTVYGALRPTFWMGRALHAAREAPILHAAARNSRAFSAPVPEDLAVFRRRFPGFAGRYSQLNYATVESSISRGAAGQPDGSILVGNSASPVNNHIDVLRRLTQIDLGNRRVIVPLSYGDPGYAAAVVEAGGRLLGDRFTPLTTFLTLDEYHTLLDSCSTVMFGAWRQVGMSNILRALWQGSRVVLDARNPVMAHLRHRGVTVDDLGEVSVLGLPDDAPDDERRKVNRAYLDAHWSQRAVLDNIRRLVAL